MALEIAMNTGVDLRVAEKAIKCGDPETALYLLSMVDEIDNR